MDGVWAAASIRGAKTSRSITKRLASSTKSGNPHSSDDKLSLNFIPSNQVEVLQSYLAYQCAQCDAHMFPLTNDSVTEEDVLEAIGWQPSDRYEEKNWEDEAWERTQVKEDLRITMNKAAKAWESWVHLYEKNPKKAARK